jgi:hypothetical protein
MNERYNVKEWETATKAGKKIFNYNYRIKGDEFDGFTLINIVHIHDEPEVKEIAYIWEKNNSKGKALIRVDITETISWKHALHHLGEHYNHCTKPNLKPEIIKTVKVGEVEYSETHIDSKDIATVSFTIGNIKVSISSVGDEPVDISKQTKIIDDLLTKPQGKKDIDSGISVDLKPENITVKKDVRHVLIDQLPEAVPRGGCIKIIVPDGEVFRDGEGLHYIPEKDGSKKVHVVKTVQE